MTTPVRAASSWIKLSVAAALVTIAIKSAAAVVTNSVGFLSDALESGVNLVAAVVTLAALRWSEAPPDKGHPFGHGKGELLAALLEGLLVGVAGLAIFGTAVERALHPAEMKQVPLGAALSIAAALVNGIVGFTLVRQGRKLRSSALEADGHHLLTDVWTSVAVVAGVGLAMVTHLSWLDPLSAAAVAVLVVRTGYRILAKAVGGLVDAKLSAVDEATVQRALAPFSERGADFAEVRTRQAGRHRFVHVRVRVPAEWTIKVAHDFADEVEHAVKHELADVIVDTHVEPLSDAPSS